MIQDKEPDRLRADGKPSEEVRTGELSAAELASRQQQTSFLLEGPEEIARKDRERRKAREKEEFELRSGEVVTFDTYLADGVQEYLPKFPNDNPFFPELFRLAGNRWKGWNPKSYTKPLEAKLYLVEMIYYRFNKEAIATLRAKATRGRNQKLFQFLNEEGQEKICEFRDDAIEMMKTFADGEIYAFRLAYAAKYNTPVQLELGK